MRIRDKRWTYILLVLGVLAAYGRVYTLGFTNFDDPGYVTQNATVQAGLTRHGIAWALTSTDQSNWHPLTWISHMIDCQLYGLNPAGHHVTSLLLHLAGAILLFELLLEMTGAIGRSFAVAAIFALHPLHVESVAWVSERKDVLSALFWILTTLFFVRYARKPNPARYLLMLSAFVLGLTAKPMLVTLPFTLLLLDLWPLNRWISEVRPKSKNHRISAGIAFRLLAEKIPLIVLSAISSAITFAAQRHGGSMMPLNRLALGERVANALISYVSYIRKMFWPADLAAFYPIPGSYGVATLIGAASVLVLISFLVIRLRRSRPYLAVGWLWYLGTLVPVIGLIQVGEQSMADRYSYIPMIGLSIMVVWSGWDLIVRFRVPRPAYAGVMIAGAVGMTALTWIQTGYWKDSRTLFLRAIQVTKDNKLAYLNYGESLVAEGDLDSAASLYREFLAKDPEVADIQTNLGLIALMQRKKDEALLRFKNALAIEPDHPDAHNGLGFLLAGEGRLEEARKQYEDALQERPSFPEARYNLGVVYYAENMAGPAEEQFREALKLRPHYAEAHERLAKILARTGRVEEALPHYEEAVRDWPAEPAFHYDFGLALLQQNQIPAARSQFEEAARLRPDWPDVLNALAWILATEPDTNEKDAALAVSLAEKALKLKDKPDPIIFDTLAAAYASQGRFEEAEKVSEEAGKLALSLNDRALALEIEQRNQLYKKRSRYRLHER